MKRKEKQILKEMIASNEEYIKEHPNVKKVILIGPESYVLNGIARALNLDEDIIVLNGLCKDRLDARDLESTAKLDAVLVYTNVDNAILSENTEYGCSTMKFNIDLKSVEEQAKLALENEEVIKIIGEKPELTDMMEYIIFTTIASDSSTFETIKNLPTPGKPTPLKKILSMYKEA